MSGKPEMQERQERPSKRNDLQEEESFSQKPSIE